MVFKMASSLNFENFAFRYPFVWVPVWVSPGPPESHINSRHRNAGHLKPVKLKPVGQMSIFGEFDLAGVVPAVLPPDAQSALQNKVL